MGRFYLGSAFSEKLHRLPEKKRPGRCECAGEAAEAKRRRGRALFPAGKLTRAKKDTLPAEDGFFAYAGRRFVITRTLPGTFGMNVRALQLNNRTGRESHLPLRRNRVKIPGGPAAVTVFTSPKCHCDFSREGGEGIKPKPEDLPFRAQKTLRAMERVCGGAFPFVKSAAYSSFGILLKELFYGCTVSGARRSMKGPDHV